jgi:IMP dehydrogenase
MVILNGDSMNGTPLLRGKEILDYKTALNVLERDYESRDGLDVQTLLDSKENGALTYNDFLVLPGFIGNATHYT